MDGKHGNTGNRNAAIGPVSRSERIALRLTPELRARLEKQAQAKKTTLSRHIVEMLERASCPEPILMIDYLVD